MASSQWDTINLKCLLNQNISNFSRYRYSSCASFKNGDTQHTWNTQTFVQNNSGLEGFSWLLHPALDGLKNFGKD